VAEITAGKALERDFYSIMDVYSTGSVGFQNILHLTDFSACSDHALQWAIGFARAHQSKLSVLHVVVPDALTYMTPDSPVITLDMLEKWACEEMRRLEERLAGLPHETFVSRGADVWPVVAPKLAELQSGLLVLGTHGRTGLGKLLLGSVAESVLRHSAIPVMTVGAEVPPCPESQGRFHRVLLATNFAAGSVETAGYATALAERDQAQLLLLHACKASARRRANGVPELSIAEALHLLHELAPETDKLRHRPEPIVEFGDAGARILEVAKRRNADLIVIGVRDAASVFAATHLTMGTLHDVVAHARCPVLSVRPRLRRAA
jgi:nucleotide-binding universal stress UspA family protein